jgi:hypothetical protein
MKAVSALALLLASGPARAQTEAWARMAEADVRAAYTLIAETHPGAVPSRGDSLFLKQLQSGRQEAEALARSARTFGAYRAALQRFAASLGDAHLSTSTWVRPDRFWPGFAVSNRSGEWKVVARADEGAPPLGTRLVSCDGEKPDALAAKRLAPFTPDWSVREHRAKASSALLTDTGNPLQPRLVACEFQTPDVAAASHRLKWQSISSARFAEHLAAASPSASHEVSLQPFDGGWWIRLGSLSGAALPLLKEAEARRAELRSAPFIVVDLRGNQGGASFFSDRLAEIIYGPAKVEAVRRPRGVKGPEKTVWRASAATLEDAAAYLARAEKFLPSGDPLIGGMAAQHEAIRQALAKGDALAEAPTQVAAGAEPESSPKPGKAPRAILVTDSQCFSSCLLAARLFRNLGALHVGEETDANTHYSNMRTITLPSGLSTFSTLQAYSTWVPKQLGPYTPEVKFTGDMADDAAVKAWVRPLLSRRTSP